MSCALPNPAAAVPEVKPAEAALAASVALMVLLVLLIA
jgi:hypothetical protein